MSKYWRFLKDLQVSQWGCFLQFKRTIAHTLSTDSAFILVLNAVNGFHPPSFMYSEWNPHFSKKANLLMNCNWVLAIPSNSTANKKNKVEGLNDNSLAKYWLIMTFTLMTIVLLIISLQPIHFLMKLQRQ